MQPIAPKTEKNADANGRQNALSVDACSTPGGQHFARRPSSPELLHDQPNFIVQRDPTPSTLYPLVEGSRSEKLEHGTRRCSSDQMAQEAVR